MNDDKQTALILRPEDGPMTCLWKAMENQDWLSSPQILNRLEEAGCKYARVTLRSKLGIMSRAIIETRPLPDTKNIYKSAKQYRIIPGRTMPVDLDQKFRGPRVTAEDDKNTQRQKESMNAAVDHMSAMMMAFVKRK